MKRKTKLLAIVSAATIVSISAISSITYAAIKEHQELSDNINSKVNSILNSLDAVSGSNISTFSINQNTNSNNTSTYSYTSETDEMDQSTFYSVDTSDYIIRLDKDSLDTKAILGKNTDFTTSTTCSEDTARNVANSIYQNLNLPSEYELVYLEQLDDCLWEADYQKSYNGTYNQYEAVKMIFSPENSEVAALSVFDTSCENYTEQTAVSSESAQEIALQTNRISADAIENVSLGFARSNDFVDENASITDATVHQVWCVEERENDTTTILYVDAHSGDVIGGETTVW